MQEACPGAMTSNYRARWWHGCCYACARVIPISCGQGLVVRRETIVCGQAGNECGTNERNSLHGMRTMAKVCYYVVIPIHSSPLKELTMQLFDITFATNLRSNQRCALAAADAHDAHATLLEVVSEGGKGLERVTSMAIVGQRECLMGEHDVYLSLDYTVGSHEWLDLPIPAISY